MFITTDKLLILANDGYRRRNGSTTTSVSSTIRATKDEKGTPNTNNTYRGENTVAECKESAVISISHSSKSTRGANFKRNNDHQEYVPDEILNLDFDGDRHSGNGHRQSIESSSSRPRNSSSGAIYDRHDRLSYELSKSRPKSSTTPLRIETKKSTDSAQLDDASHDVLMRSAGSDYENDTEELSINFGSSKCRQSRSSDFRDKDTKLNDKSEITRQGNYPPAGSAPAFPKSYYSSPTDLIEDVGEPQEYYSRPIPKKESDMSRCN
jgi:hypothetical protein